MKKQILMVFAVLSAFIVNASTAGSGGDDKKLTIGLSVGAAVPLGAYGKADTLNATDSTHRNGWAKTGLHFDLTAGYRFAGNFGAMILIGGNMNSFDAATYATNNKVVAPATVTAKSYFTGQYLIGPYAAIPAGDKMRINFRVLVGLVMANTPSITESETVGSASDTRVYSGNGGSGFGYHFGAGIQYNFTDGIGLTVNLAYTGASLSFTGYTENESGSFGSFNYVNTTLKQTLSTGIFTGTVGVAFNF